MNSTAVVKYVGDQFELWLHQMANIVFLDPQHHAV